MPRFADFQFEIYRAGVTGDCPALPMTAPEVEKAARQEMTARAYGYVAGSAGLESTEQGNRRAFERWEIVPRHLRGVPERDLSIQLFGKELPTPVLLAPIGAMSIVREDAELSVARVAASLGVPMILSTVSSTPLELVASELASEAGGSGWFQLYWPSDRELALSLVRRAEAAGFGAVVVTLDTWTLSWRPRDLANGYLPFLTGAGLANYLSDPVFRSRLARSPEEDPEAAIGLWTQLFGYPSLRLTDLRWLREQTSLPILVKGVCHPDDARAALEAGLDGVVVSNHGGRQIDGARASLDCLPEVVAASGEMTVLLDSGVRSGSDVVKALALGAKAVLLGRPYVYGLALAGEDGVRHVLRCLLAELDLTLGLSGHGSISELGPASVARRS
ncbi:MAG TPA: lactate 2-monooxygenase [Candidatus Dormibacteraeota bacterium]|nr:lactate 2-monooxygenase [Candidatus Dormibacteraeota bacterium]